MNKWFFVVVLALCGLVYYSATLPDTLAVDALTKQGFADVTITKQWPVGLAQVMGCGEGDIAAFKADATNVRGEKVTDITVCAGLLKAMTIRF